MQLTSPRNIRLIKGSHFVVPKMYDGEQAYILQNEDHRIVFVIPYNNDFTLVGTTDKEYTGDPRTIAMDSDEESYLLTVVNAHFSQQLTSDDIRWRYSGVRPLCDDESDSPSAITRDYTLELETDESQKAPLLSIFGGKITTYRKLSEAALAEIKPFFPAMGASWTANSPITGGDIGNVPYHDWVTTIRETYPWLTSALLARLTNAYGTLIHDVLADASCLNDLGECFGANLHQQEVSYLVKNEWASNADDVLWRRTKLGLHFNSQQTLALEAFVKTERQTLPATQPAISLELQAS